MRPPLQLQASENLGFETWGLDAEAENEMVRCRDLLKDDARFLAIESKFSNVRKIVTGIYFGEIKDFETGEIFKLNDDEKLDGFLAKVLGADSLLEAGFRSLVFLSVGFLSPNDFFSAKGFLSPKDFLSL